MTDLKVQNINADQLNSYSKNARLHSEDQISQIAASIQEFGFVNPILIRSDMTVIAGHGRLEAAHLLGMKQVPVIILDTLTEEQARALTLADNRIAENAEWDWELVKFELDDLTHSKIDFEALGIDFNTPEFLEFSLSDEEREEIFRPVSENEQPRIDQIEKKTIICPKCKAEISS